jgi:WD40 repeat protein
MKKLYILLFLISLNVFCFGNDAIKIWDINTGKLVNQINTNQNNWIEVIMFNKENLFIQNNDNFYLYKINGLEKIKQIVFKELIKKVATIITVTDNDKIIYYSERGIYEGDINSLKVNKVYQYRDGEADPCIFKYNKIQKTLVTVDTDGIIKIFDMKTKKKLKIIKNLYPYASKTDMCLSSDGKYLITSDRGGYVCVIDLDTLKIIKKFIHEYKNSNPLSVAISPDGKYIASGGTIDKIIKLWDVKTGKLLKELKGHTSVIYSLQFSPDGIKLLSASGKCDEFNLTDDKIKLWDVSTGKVITEIKGNKESAYRAIFTPDGSNIITWDGGQTPIDDGRDL